MINKPEKNKIRLKRHARIRNTISGTLETPRLNVFRSSKNIYAALIDDTTGNTLVSSSSLVIDGLDGGGNIAAAQAVGKDLAEKALEKGIKNVVFDRGGYVYHGRVKSLADAAREAGLEF